jgi:hypothetical protein
MDHPTEVELTFRLKVAASGSFFAKYIYASPLGEAEKASPLS